MNETTNKPEDQPERKSAAEAAPAPATKGAATPGGSEQQAAAAPEAADLAQLQAEVETLKGQIADLTDRLLRAHAEMDNMRKRSEREKADTTKYAITKFARDVVNVADNFQRAISAVPPDAAVGNAALNSLLEGVSMTEREFFNVLERHGVKRVDPQGEAFNPHQHQAMMEMENSDVPAGTVLQVYQAGYLIEDRVLRPAMVIVSKRGARPANSGNAGAPSEVDKPETTPGAQADAQNGGEPAG